MSQSTDAILAFGIDLGNELPKYWVDNDLGFEDVVMREAGIQEPTGPDVDWSAYWTKRNGLIDNYPLEMIYHCYVEEPMHFLAIRGTQLSASRGYPEKVKQLEQPSDEQINALRAFCEHHNIEWQEFGWYLFSNWA